jgi:hypothetical protein
LDGKELNYLTPSTEKSPSKLSIAPRISSSQAAGFKRGAVINEVFTDCQAGTDAGLR